MAHDNQGRDEEIITKLGNALRVLVYTGSTRAWLKENDPMALKQAYEALALTEDACLFPDSHQPGHRPDRKWHVTFNYADWEDLTEAEIEERMEVYGYTSFSSGSDWDYWYEELRTHDW